MATVLITGIKGVGKTTIMFGLCRITGELEPKITCAYHNYDEGKLSLVDVLREQTTLAIAPGASFKDVLANVGQSGRGLAMFLDEIQSLYVEQYAGEGMLNPDYEKFINIVRDIQRLGKTGPHGFGVISGSTNNTRDRVYLQDRVAKAGSYPNLNDGVYREYTLRPFRACSEFERAVRSIMAEGRRDEPTSEGDDQETSGTNASHLSSSSSSDDDEVKIAQYFFCTGGEVTKKYSGDRTSNFRRALTNQVAFFALVTRLSLVTPDPAFCAENAFVVPSISHTDLDRIVRPRLRLTDNFRAVINKWVDKGLLYKTEEARYQLLVPADIELYRKHADAGGDLFLNAALLGTLLGWGGHASAGHVIEDFFRRRLLEDEHFDSWEIASVVDTRPNSIGCLSGEDLANTGLADFRCRFFHQTKDSGLDGVFVCVDPDHETGIQLHALLIKTGNMAKKITTGGQVAKKPDDRTIVGIIAEAQLGFQRLFDSLRKGPLKERLPRKTTFTSLHQECRRSRGRLLTERASPSRRVAGRSALRVTSIPPREPSTYSRPNKSSCLAF